MCEKTNKNSSGYERSTVPNNTAGYPNLDAALLTESAEKRRMSTRMEGIKSYTDSARNNFCKYVYSLIDVTTLISSVESDPT